MASCDWIGRFIGAGLCAALAFSNVARAENERDDDKGAAPEVGATLKVVPGAKVTLACDTNAIGMDSEPFKTSNGTLTLELSFAKAEPSGGDGGASGASDDDALGTWTGSAVVLDHEASLGLIAHNVCKDGCVLRRVPSGNLELWAPRPVMPATLGKDKTVTLAALDVATLELKATVFRGNQLSVLENGTCKIVNP